MMKKFAALNTYFKLLVLIVGTTLFFVLLYLSLYIYTMQQEREVYQTTSNQYGSEVTSLIELNSRTHIATIKDVTYWTDLVRYTQTKDKQWFQKYIATEFETYEVDEIAVYDLTGQCIDRITSGKVKSGCAIPADIFAALYQKRLMRFYLRCPQGMMEIFGATIHTSDDPNKTKTKPAGYFIMTRLIDAAYLQHLNQISNSSTEVLPGNIQPNGDDASVLALAPLKDWKNRTIGVVTFKRPFTLDFRGTKRILLIIIIAFLLNILLYLYFSKRWVYKPLSMITRFLETGEQITIDELKKEPGEFGHIGDLFQENSNQQKQLEISKKKAEENDKLKSAFLANLSHEIRTPMNAIVGFSDLLMDKNLSENDRDEYVSIIRNSGRNLVSIIEDLIEMSKIDAKQIAPKLSSFDLDVFCEELYDEMKVTIPKGKKIKFVYNKSSGGTINRIITDKTKLRQIMVNLLTNAFKYTERGTVSFGFVVHARNRKITFSVKDSGKGIDEKNLKAIFDRFRRVEDDFSVELSGLGLGLAISKAYVEMLGGQIGVTSEVGKGSEFTFSIPLQFDNLHPEQPVENGSSGVDFQANHDKVILVAEDDNINFLLLKKILQLRNYTILRAVNGQEAVTICSTNPAVDLVLMDIKMPVMDGYGALEKIRMFLPELPIVAQTAHSSLEDKERVMQAGFNDYVTKPLDKDRVFNVIDTIFSKQQRS